MGANRGLIALQYSVRPPAVVGPLAEVWFAQPLPFTFHGVFAR